MKMKIQNTTTTIQIFSYLIFMCFYNLYGKSFSVEVNKFIGQIYFLVTSVTLMVLSYDIAKRNSGVLLFVASFTLFVHSIFISIFNVACILNLSKVATLVNDGLISSLVFFITFTVTLILSLYGRLDKGK